MKNKSYRLSELSLYAKDKISKDLSIHDLLNLATTSKENWSYLKENLFFSKGLNAAAKGHYDVFEDMLQQDFRLAFIKGTVTDYSGRYFPNVSVFEYALWALDNNLWILILNKLAKADNAQFIEILIEQYRKITEEGLSYSLQGQQINEKQFDFEGTLLKALHTQVDLLTAVPHNPMLTQQQWQKDVGSAQKLLPMHVVYRYCMRKTYHDFHNPTHPNYFFNYLERKHFIQHLISLFKASKRDKAQSIIETLFPEPMFPQTLYNPLTSKDENWFAAEGLGDTFAVQLGSMSEPPAMGIEKPNFFSKRIKYSDLPTFKTLFETRVKDLISLDTKLDALQKEYEASQALGIVSRTA